MAKAILNPGREKRILRGHPWVFRSDIERVDGEFTPGDVVDVHSAKRPLHGPRDVQPRLADRAAHVHRCTTSRSTRPLFAGA